MKLVKEHINEKFTADSDPIRDMGIGIIRHHDFKSDEEAAAFIFKHLHRILQEDEIPKNILAPYNSGYNLNWKYYKTLNSFITTFVTIEGKKQPKDSWILEMVHTKLVKTNKFKKLKFNHDKNDRATINYAKYKNKKYNNKI